MLAPYVDFDAGRPDLASPDARHMLLTRIKPQTFLRLRNYSSSVGEKLVGTLSMSVQQPPWTIPVKEHQESVLKIYNSLTRTKVRIGNVS